MRTSKSNIWAGQLCAILALVAASLALALAPSRAAEDPAAQALSVTHQLAAGDILKVALYDGLERTEYTLQVDEQGEVRMPLVGSVPVLGLLPRAAAELLTARYATYYVAPLVDVSVESYGALRIFVFGPDFSGRVVALPSGSHLLDLLDIEPLAPSPANESWQATAANGKGAAGNGNGHEGPAGAITAAAEQPTTKVNPLYTRGSYRKLHLIRGAGAFANLPQAAALSSPSLASSGESGLAASTAGSAVKAADPAPAGGTGLSSVMNWRSWIAASRHDPAVQLWVIDPLRITLEGELSQFNLPLRDGDVLYSVPELFVDISGVAKPGRYELLEEESLGDLLRIAGSVEYGSDLRNTVVQRYTADGRLTRILANIYPGLDDVAAVESLRLENRDRIAILPYEERVFVLGEVNTAGAFAFTGDSTVLDYLALAGGDTERAHLAWIAVIRQGRDRLEPGAAPEVLRLNFKELHAGYPNCSEVQPLPGDVIYVPPKGKDFEVAQVLSAVGTVINSYALINRTNSSSN